MREEAVRIAQITALRWKCMYPVKGTEREAGLTGAVWAQRGSSWHSMIMEGIEYQTEESEIYSGDLRATDKIWMKECDTLGKLICWKDEGCYKAWRLVRDCRCGK